MARPYVLPDPKDRSVNAPKAIMSGQQVLGLYNQVHSDDKKERVADSVKEWLVSEAKKEGWADVQFAGNQAILTANVVLGDEKNDPMV